MLCLHLLQRQTYLFVLIKICVSSLSEHVLTLTLTLTLTLAAGPAPVPAAFVWRGSSGPPRGIRQHASSFLVPVKFVQFSDNQKRVHQHAKFESFAARDVLVRQERSASPGAEPRILNVTSFVLNVLAKNGHKISIIAFCTKK